MELEKPEPKKAPKKPTKGATAEVYRKISGTGLKILTTLKERANKKAFGKSVKDGDIIELALTLITENHLAELQDRTLTNQDRLKMSHENYCKDHGRIPYDEFLGKLMHGEIKVRNQSNV